MAPSTKTLKRATDFKPSTSKRAKVTVSPRDKRINTVMSALESEETVLPGTASCRAMLVTAAPSALQIPKDERHADQEAVFGMLSEIFDAEKARWETRVAEANTVVENATAEQTEKVGLKDAADTALKSQKEVVRMNLEAQIKAEEVVSECKEELSAAMASRDGAELLRDGIFKDQESVLALQEVIKGLNEGSYENPKEVKRHVAAVTELFQSLGAEEALVKTLPQILRRKPEERGNFDEMALQQLDTYMKNHLDALSCKLEAAEKTVVEHATAVTAWDATIQVAEEKKKESDTCVAAASLQQDDLQKELQNARKILKEQTAAVKRYNSDLATEQYGLQSVEGVLEALDFLHEYIAPVPAPEEPSEGVAPAPEQVAVETPRDVEMVSTNSITTTKGKETTDMDFDDVPSPSKRTRVSLGGAAPVHVA